MTEPYFKASAIQISADSARRAEAGFTLVEIIAVLVILSLLAALTIPRFINLDQSASWQALASGVAQLNSREVMTWSNVKLSDTGWIDDAQVFSQLNTDLGNDYRWTPSAAIGGGTLGFKGFTVSLNRSPSTATSPGRWQAP